MLRKTEGKQLYLHYKPTSAYKSKYKKPQGSAETLQDGTVENIGPFVPSPVLRTACAYNLFIKINILKSYIYGI